MDYYSSVYFSDDYSQILNDFNLPNLWFIDSFISGRYNREELIRYFLHNIDPMKRDDKKKTSNYIDYFIDDDAISFDYRIEQSDGNGNVTKASLSKEIKTNVNTQASFSINLSNNKILFNNESHKLLILDTKTNRTTLLKTGYKVGIVDGLQVIIELKIYDDSIIYSRLDKHRTNHCMVQKIYDEDGNEYQQANGKYVEVCTNGIHFCHSINELIKHGWLVQVKKSENNSKKVKNPQQLVELYDNMVKKCYMFDNPLFDRSLLNE